MTNTKTEKLTKVAESIASQIERFHEGRRSWNPNAGQWLVYGFERYFGFSGAAELEADIESAFRAKKDVKTAALNFLLAKAGVQ